MLLDLKMPRLNGFDVLSWLRQQPGLKRLLVTILTSSDQPDDINRAYDLGANSYLLKPHNSSHLSELVAQVKHYWLDLNQCRVALTEQFLLLAFKLCYDIEAGTEGSIYENDPNTSYGRV